MPIPPRLEKYQREGAVPQTQSEKGLLSHLQGNGKKMKNKQMLSDKATKLALQTPTPIIGSLDSVSTN